MALNDMIERAIIGELVLALTEQDYRVELCTLDGGGLHLYAAPDGGQIVPGECEWVRLVEGNGVDIISDFSATIEPYIQRAIDLSAKIEAL